jgi:predicted transposase/invertase (TIGR01784 family)
MALSITYEQIEAEILERGEARGEAKGSKAAAQSIARNLLQEGMAPEAVARVTGIPLDELPTIE